MAVLLCASNAVAFAQSQPIEITTKRIGRDVELIGELGKKLGTRIEISGVWKFPEHVAKDNSIRFYVDSVDGNELPKPIEFNVAQLNVRDELGASQIPDRSNHDKLDGKRWSFVAYETGRISVSPQWYDKSHVRGSVAAPYYMQPFMSLIVGRMEKHTPSAK